MQGSQKELPLINYLGTVVLKFVQKTMSVGNAIAYSKDMIP